MMDRHTGRIAAERISDPRSAAPAEHTFARRIDCAEPQRPRDRAPAARGRGFADLDPYGRAGRSDRY